VPGFGAAVAIGVKKSKNYVFGFTKYLNTNIKFSKTNI
jgi:hypothetical protein